MTEKEEFEHLRIIKDFYKLYDYSPETADTFDEEDVDLFRELHAKFVMKGFTSLPRGFESLDSGQPWFIYWLSNVLDLLDMDKYKLSMEQKLACVKYIAQCQHKDGGFAGAPYLEAHLASTYAAMMAIVTLDIKEAYEIVDVPKMKQFLIRMKNNNFQEHNQEVTGDIKCSELNVTDPGAFQIHQNGENDLRACYCALVTADILGLIDEKEIREGVSDYIASCQTYEGGISCHKYGESHGGYTFCGLASLVILNEANKLDLERLLEWLVNRQLTKEGGFNGRINKLVDSCYNFWQGAIFELLDIASKGKFNYKGEWLFNQKALQGYTLLCCQETGGGMRDKPGKQIDYYHTCYSLSGLAIAQSKSRYLQQEEKVFLTENKGNQLVRPDAVYNALGDKVSRAKNYFWTKLGKEYLY